MANEHKLYISMYDFLHVLCGFAELFYSDFTERDGTFQPRAEEPGQPGEEL